MTHFTVFHTSQNRELPVTHQVHGQEIEGCLENEITHAQPVCWILVFNIVLVGYCRGFRKKTFGHGLRIKSRAVNNNIVGNSY